MFGVLRRVPSAGPDSPRNLLTMAGRSLLEVATKAWAEVPAQAYHAGQNVYLPVFCFEGLISEFPKFTYRIPSLRASFSSQVKKCRKPDLFLGCRFSVR